VRETRTAAGLPPGTEIASSTNANAALGAGVPAVSIGLTNGGGAHTVDEYVELEPLRAGADAALLLVERLS
jgi:acetylornithine deacetylase/succinyl-diaminopimelate desuccinylase-like protein